MVLLAPLKRPTFRTLWAGMGLSYAGDRLQELAQSWLVATLTVLLFFGGVLVDRFGIGRIAASKKQ